LPASGGVFSEVPPLSFGEAASVSALMAEVTAADIARSIGVPPATLRRWVRSGVVPQKRGKWSPSAVAQARIVARLRERGHTMTQIREAVQSGRLAYGYLEQLFPDGRGPHTLRDAADRTGLEPALIERIWSSLGFPSDTRERGFSEADLELLEYGAAVLQAGFPLVAFLQLTRVYGQALAQLADAEVKLFHLYVHEPLMRDGVPGLKMAEEMQDLAAELLPLTAPMMDGLHRRLLRHFIEQDVVGHMEAEADFDLGRLRVAIAFADLAGYTRLTEQAGEEQALDVVERFVAGVEATLPDDARVIKTIGDEVMVVGSDAAALVDWAAGYQRMAATARPRPRIGMHAGAALYRDGDYYGHAVNLASRVAARAAGGEVLVTRPVVDTAGAHLSFDQIGEVKMKGFSEPTELFVATQAPDDR
jgi:adenylate cyclase